MACIIRNLFFRSLAVQPLLKFNDLRCNFFISASIHSKTTRKNKVKKASKSSRNNNSSVINQSKLSQLKRRTRSEKELDEETFLNKYGNDNSAHVPVLLGEVLDVFTSVTLRSFLDCTLGAAGHSSAISNYASIIFISLFISIAATGGLEMQWGGVGIDDWWRNEQFWVIGGASSHFFALFQGLLKVLAGVETSFTVTSKAGDDGAFSDLYIFKWTSLLIPPTTLLIINIVGVVVGVSNAINNGYDSWGPLFGRLFFALWVIIHLFPFLKGLSGKQE